MSQVLSLEQLDVVYDRISQTPTSQLRAFDLEFMATFAEQSQKRARPADDDPKWYGLELFWRVVMDESSNPEIFQLTSSTLQRLLQLDVYASQRQVYLGKCLKGLTRGKAVVRCLQMCMDIIRILPDKRSDVFAVLEVKHGLSLLLLEDIERYQKQAARPMSPNADSVDRQQHAQQLQARLDFLSFLSRSSELTLDYTAAERLWGAFVLQRNSPSDEVQFMSWLCAIASSQRTFAFAVIRDIFDKLLCSDTLDLSILTLAGFKCVQVCFIIVNATAKCLANGSVSKPVVTDFQGLKGLDSLHRLARHAPSDVAQAAADFATSLYLRLHYDLSGEEKKRIWCLFIDRAVADLRTLLLTSPRSRADPVEPSEEDTEHKEVQQLQKGSDMTAVVKQDLVGEYDPARVVQAIGAVISFLTRLTGSADVVRTPK